MVNRIIDGISIRINEVFGDDYEIYSEDIEQGFKEPCFFILPLNQKKSPKLKNRSFREYSFNIHYFPTSSYEKRREINSVLHTLMDELEYISIDNDLIRGTNIKSEVVDNILHFFINYNLFTINSSNNDEDMTDISIKEITKR